MASLATPAEKNRFSIGAIIFVAETSILLLCIVWAFAKKIPVFETTTVSFPALLKGIALGACILLSSGIFTVLDLIFFKGSINRRLTDQFYPLFKNVGFSEILFLAVMSGICEEFFFRGVLFPQAGIIISSLLFGILHIPDKDMWFLGLWTALIGAAFALVYKATGNLFIPVAAHFFNNLIAVMYIRYYHFSKQKESENEKINTP